MFCWLCGFPVLHPKRDFSEAQPVAKGTVLKLARLLRMWAKVSKDSTLNQNSIIMLMLLES